ncbi:ABC transporter substrate-binding protein [Microbacterium kribbense]|uniref:ABC transporter substrate-binding protein n=1 Tax=Microbacterium kribbense TaxID=433645 RepID=A0ABP7G2M7_9MICO
MSSRSRRYAAVAVLATAAMLMAGCAGTAAASPGDGPITFAVSGPATGINAEYGGFWKRGFAVALDEVNAVGGVNGRHVKLDWYDSQSDPKQSVTVAQQIVADPHVIAEIGDFSSPASMAATPIYQANGLLQYAATSSSPDFTKGGTVAFAPELSQAVTAAAQADAAVKVSKKIAVLYQNTDWGTTTFGIFKKRATANGATLTATSSYLPTSTDFRSVLQNVKASDPDLLYIIGYDPDESAIIKQARQIGWSVPVFASQFSKTAIGLTGAASEGVYTTDAWWPESDVPAVKSFVAAFQKKYDGDLPNQFEAGAYDAVTELVAAVKQGGATRAGVLKGIVADKKLPSVRFGDFAFGADRRPPAIPMITLVVKDGVLTRVE